VPVARVSCRPEARMQRTGTDAAISAESVKALSGDVIEKGLDTVEAEFGRR
jgi:hypothetical protein